MITVSLAVALRGISDRQGDVLGAGRTVATRRCISPVPFAGIASVSKSHE